eukprot:TRINITY_DN288_c0_g1_i2.p1 TRINITY_DN288_c0_g1~~TRINITY_DN288_c0_g1_i2.p1  ORF type:complete len:645 (+),score=256.71 TRINITY_DN288_c0_g1_i2:92-1936(+)
MRLAVLLGAAAAAAGQGTGAQGSDEGCIERFAKVCPQGREMGAADCLRCLRRKFTQLRGCSPRSGQQWCTEEGGAGVGREGSKSMPDLAGPAAPAPPPPASPAPPPPAAEKPPVPVVPGDLFVIRVRRKGGQQAMLASFHGDTNGLATIPVTSAVAKAHQQTPSHWLIFGMDGNTYGTPKKDQQGLQAFADWLYANGLETVWGPKPDNNRHTTFNARTYLQPQLNKAALATEREEKGDKNLKDHIVFAQGSFTAGGIERDNTGQHRYEDDVVFPTLQFPSDHGVLSATLSTSDGTEVRAVTWNVAAINNNPFEYWITGGDDYNQLLQRVAEFVTNPGAADVPVSQVFTPEMWASLRHLMTGVEGWEGKLDYVSQRWAADFSSRKIVSGFLRDSSLGKKRLASMPDRVTNTIRLSNGTTYRPTVINCYAGDLGSMDKWFEQWTKFFFTGLDGGKRPVDVLPPIKRSKYPAVTEEEEANSQPLSLLAQAIFDAILVHMVNKVSPKWQDIRREMCAALNQGKDTRILGILADQYSSAHVIFLQEAAGSLVDEARAGPIGEKYHVLTPAAFDRSRNQNSVILLAKEHWNKASVREVTASVMPEAAAKTTGAACTPAEM